MDLTLLDHVISTASHAVAVVATIVMLTDRRRRRGAELDRRSARPSRPAP